MIHQIKQDMIKYFNGDVRRINHAVKVHGFASTIAALEELSPEDQLVVELAALLHDIGIHEAERKHNSNSGKFQELEGPPIAAEILVKYPFPKSVIDRVCYLIGNHHTYSKIDGGDFQALVEADFIVNIFEDHMSSESIGHIQRKIFKTKTGLALLQVLYGKQQEAHDA